MPSHPPYSPPYQQLLDATQPPPGAPRRAATPPARITQALAAPRCAHVKLDGSRCGGSALQGKPLCRFHVRALRTESPASLMPVFEDALSIQLALVRVVRGLESGSMPSKTAALILYALQIATMNLKRLEAAMSQTSSSAAEAREKSLAEELLNRLDDEDFCQAVLADAPPLDYVPPTWGALGPIAPKNPDGGTGNGGAPR